MPTSQTTSFIQIFRISLFVLITCFYSCKSSTLIGIYKSQEPNLLVRQFEYHIMDKSRTSGTTLRLKADSTYWIETCANIGNGKWSINNDSLLLLPEVIRWKIDSLNLVKPIKDFGKHSYLVQGSKLVSIFAKLEKKGKTIMVYEVLEKVSD